MHDQQLSLVVKSPGYRAFACAFQEATGLSLALVPAGKEAGEAGRRDTELCSLLRRLPTQRINCATCWRGVVGCAVETKRLQSAKCPAGIVDAAMPIFSGGQHMATLMVGKVFRHRRRLEDWRRIAELAGKCGQHDLREILRAYRAVPVVPAGRFRAACVLLEFFAKTLEERIPRWLASDSAEVPLSVRKAKEFIRKHAGDQVKLPDVARHAGLGVQHFCEIFKRHTGQTFTGFLAVERVERAKALLRNEALQVAEVAFACGFESITSFNRAFKRLTGVPPTEYRLSVLNMKRQLIGREDA